MSERKKRYYRHRARPIPTPTASASKAIGATATCSAAPKSSGSKARSAASATPSDYGKLNYNAAIMFEKPGVIGPPSRFFATSEAVSEHPDAYDRFSVGGEIGVAYDITRYQSVSASLRVEYEDIDDVLRRRTPSYRQHSAAIRLGQAQRQAEPDEGLAVAGVHGTRLRRAERSRPSSRCAARRSTYVSFDAADRYVIAGRVAAGSIVGAEIEDIPADRRFYAGGGGSVRGYAYQSIGPKFPDGHADRRTVLCGGIAGIALWRDGNDRDCAFHRCRHGVRGTISQFLRRQVRRRRRRALPDAVRPFAD